MAEKEPGERLEKEEETSKVYEPSPKPDFSEDKLKKRRQSSRIFNKSAEEGKE